MECAPLAEVNVSYNRHDQHFHNAFICWIRGTLIIQVNAPNNIEDVELRKGRMTMLAIIVDFIVVKQPISIHASGIKTMNNRMGWNNPIINV